MEKYFIIFAIAIMCLMQNGKATVYTVGDSTGWDISTDFPSWVWNKTFNVGDTLVFQYSMYHTLNEVDKPSYENCSTDNTLMTGNTGNTTIPLTGPGNRYFICGVLIHCLGGMKLAVNVKQNGSVSAVGSPASAPVSPDLSSLSPGNSDGGATFLPPLFSGSDKFGKGPIHFSLFCTIGTLFMVLIAKL